jgi:tetratricopeptide (TPR) repeat protein
VRVVPLQNRTGDAAFDSLAARATDALEAGLRAVPVIRILHASDTAAPTWMARGAVQREGGAIRITAQLEGDSGNASGEPFEVSGDTGALPDRLRAAAIDEARLLARQHDRRFRAEHGTSDPAARAKLLQYLAMVGPAPGRVHFAAGLPLLDAAIAADPDYAPARVERAHLRAIGAGGGKTVDRIAAATADLDRAKVVALDEPSIAEMRCRVLQVASAAAVRPSDAAIAAARDACEAALHVAPDSGYVLIALARLHDLSCHDEDAILLLEKSLEIDRGLSGRALSHIVSLALTHGRLGVADRMSQRLVALQEEEARLGPRAFTRRSGANPVENAHYLRAAVLLRLGREPEAAAELASHLSTITVGRANELNEAAALRGLARIEERRNAALAPDLARRLATLEAGFRETSAKEPEQAALVSDAYALVDPQAAVGWLDRASPPASCREALDRALVLLWADQKDRARAALAACVPVEQWERSCMQAVGKLIES